MPGQNLTTATQISMKAIATITRGQLVKLGANEDEVTPTTAATDVFIGVAINDAASGEHVAIHTDGGLGYVLSSGSIALGAKLTASATAGAVATAAPGAGTNAEILGYALRAAASGDLFPFLPARGVMQG